MEDHIPLDPTPDVRVRFGDEVFRLFPGSMERPVADVARAQLVSNAIDVGVVRQMGFGIEDYVRVALREIDREAAVFASAWPTRPALAPGGPATVSQPEFDAASSLTAIWELPPSDEHRLEREQLALEWGSCEGKMLPYSPLDANSSFGHYLALRDNRGAATPLPMSSLGGSVACRGDQARLELDGRC